MLLLTGPNWLGSPQHFFGGLGLALAVVGVARLLRIRTLPACAAAIGLVSTVEILIELFEYPVLYAGRFHATAYYDTLADMANTMVGAVLGVVLAASLVRLRARRRASSVAA